MNNPAPKVPSPCLGVCKMNEATGYCLGCYRTLSEVSGWWQFPEEKKKQVVEELEKRKSEDT